MKYVMLREHAGLELRTPIFGVAPLTHAQLAAGFTSTHAPVSAGFCAPLEDGSGRWRVWGRSESLGLVPDPGDAVLIETFVKATLTFAAA